MYNHFNKISSVMLFVPDTLFAMHTNILNYVEYELQEIQFENFSKFAFKMHVFFTFIF